MKKIYLLLLVLFLSISIAQSQSWKSSNQLFGTSDLSVIATCSDSHNNTYIYGYFNGSITPPGIAQIDSRGGRDLFLAKFDTASNLLWVNGLGGALHEFLDGGMCIAPTDEIFLTGSFQSDFYYTDVDFISSAGSHDIFLAKFNLDGDAIWCRNVGTGASYQRSTELKVDTDYNVILAGYFNDSITIASDTTVYEYNDFKDYYIAKFEATDGDLTWIKSYESIDSDYSGFIYSIRTTGDNYYLSGVFGDSVRIEDDTIVSETQTYYDTHILKTDTSGNVEWIRLIKGNWHDYSYTSVIDASENIYITGYFNSSQLTVDSTESTSIVVNPSGASYDFFIAKYDSNGTLQWIRVNGGKGEDRLLRSEIFDNELHVSGYFSDTLHWGGIELTTNGVTDQDMFTGSMDLDGNYRTANSFGGTSNSTEAGIAVFNTSDAVYQVIQSNSDILVLGDSIYLSSTGFKYIVVGNISCLPITVQQVIISDTAVLCYEDSTVSIVLAASGGFGGPYEYSIDNGESSSSIPVFNNVPGGDYTVVVFDQEGCSEVDSSFTIYEPDELILITDSVQNPWGDPIRDGFIWVDATGGTGLYEYVLLPDSTEINDTGEFYFTELETGSYRVKVYDENTCMAVIDTVVNYEVGFETRTGLEAKVYPNPTSGLITLEMPFEDPEANMEVINMTGQLVMNRKLYSSGGVINETIDLSDQAKGLYLIRLDGQALQSAIMVK